MPVGKVVNLEGNGYIVVNDKPIPLHEGMEIPQNVTIYTRKDTKVTVEFLDETFLSFADTEITVDEILLGTLDFDGATIEYVAEEQGEDTK
jgi:hypothetical protein